MSGVGPWGVLGSPHMTSPTLGSEGILRRMGLSRQSSFDLRTKISSEFFPSFNRTCFEKFDSGKKRSYFSLKRDQVDSICIFFCFFVSKMESSMTEIQKYNEAIIFSINPVLEVLLSCTNLQLSFNAIVKKYRPGGFMLVLKLIYCFSYASLTSSGQL